MSISTIGEGDVGEYRVGSYTRTGVSTPTGESVLTYTSTTQNLYRATGTHVVLCDLDGRVTEVYELTGSDDRR